MMYRTFTAVLIAALTSAGGAATTSASTQSRRSLTERVRIGAHVYRSDARVVSTWRGFDAAGARTTRADAIYTMESMCVFNAIYSPVPDRVGYGWTFEVSDLAATVEQATIRLSWRRTRERGQPISSPNGAVTLTLRPGQSVPLDYIVASSDPTAWGPCTAVGMLLDVSVER